VQLIDLKGFDASNGTTLWEYGVAGTYCLHYGAGKFSAIKHDSTAAANKYGIVAQPNVFFEIPPRIGGSLPAIIAETLSLVAIDPTDGTETASVALEDWYTEIDNNTANSLRMWNARIGGAGIGSAIGLSGGNVAFGGHIEPAVVWDDRTDNNATKSYRLLPHTQSEGKVYFLTKTNRQTITVDYNDTAAEIVTAFEAVGDVTSATATGGPWPLVAIELTVTWAAATGDIQGIKRDARATVGTPPSTASRPVMSAAFVVNASAGTLRSTLGHRLGRGDNVAISNLMPASGPPGSVTLTPAILGGSQGMVAADSDLVAVLSDQNETIECWDASGTGANGWSRSWARLLNAPVVAFSKTTSLQCQNAVISVSVARQAYNGTTYAGATIPTSSGTPSHWDNDRITTSTTGTERLAAHVAEDGDASYRWCTVPRRLSTGQTFWFQGIEQSDNTIDLALGVSRLFGVSATTLYGLSTGSTAVGSATPVAWPTTNVLTTGTLAGSLATFRRLVYYWPGTWFKADTEFRFTFFPGGGSSQSTAWMAWPGSAAGITSALTTLFGENTEGVYNNISIWIGGTPPALDNADFSELMQNIDIRFAVRPQADNPFGHVPQEFITTQSRIEVRYAETVNQGNMTAWSNTDATVVWSRDYGDVTDPITSQTRIVAPWQAWYSGDYVWAAGGPVNAEL